MSENRALPFDITVESPEPWQRVIKVQVPRSEYDRQYQRRLAEAVRGHQRPGFRKGKTPRAIVEKELGDRLRAETFEGMVPQAYRAAMVEHRLFPITEPKLENLVFDDDKDLAFDLKVEVRPEVTARDYEGIAVTERTVEIKDEEVGEVVERLRESRAFFEKVDRAAADGDQVVLDLVPLGDDGEVQEDRRMAGQRLILGDEQNLPEFSEGLLGVVASEEREIRVEYPGDYPNADLREQTVVFRCNVDSVRVKVVPEADDAFASQLEEGQTLLELRTRIRDGLVKEAEKRVAQELDEQILDRIIERNDMPVPPSMVESWLGSGVQDLQQRQTQMGRELTEDDVEKYREAARPVAERQIKGMFLMESVRKQESIEVDDEQVNERVVEIAAENGFDLEKYREFVEQGEEKGRIRHGLEERRTYDFLLSRAEVSSEAADTRGRDEDRG